MEDAHNVAFQAVVDVVKNDVIKQQNVIKLSTLRTLYINHLKGTDFENNRAQKLKEKLLKNSEIGKYLNFTVVEGDNSNTWPFNIVYSSQMATSAAIVKAYKLASVNSLKSVALIIRNSILTAFTESLTTEVEWPPDPYSLCNFSSLRLCAMSNIDLPPPYSNCDVD